MKLKYTLAAGMLMFGAAANAQDWIHDTISTGSGNLTNVYYSLEEGDVKQADAKDWHLGFATEIMDQSIITNSADNGVRLYIIVKDSTKFGTNLTADLASAITAKPMPLYNSNSTWTKGAFNNAAAGEGATYGWGEYVQSSHWVVGTVVYGLITATDTFQVFIKEKQTFSVTNPPIYVFKIANIDGTDVKEKTLTIGGSSYVDKNFAYYNIATDAFVDREPLAEDWDFVFSRYNDEGTPAGNVLYPVFGVINNEALEVAKIADVPRSGIDALDYEDYEDYDTVNNSIGISWKVYGSSNIADSASYFIKVANGDIWQLAFTHNISGMAGENPGRVALQKRKVYEYKEVSVEKVNAFVDHIVVAPNPAVSGSTNLLVDAKQAVRNAQLMITDINGRVVYKAGIDLLAGFRQLPLDVSQYASGLYIIQLSGSGFNTTQKLVVR